MPSKPNYKPVPGVVRRRSEQAECLRMRNLERIWWYVQREFHETINRPVGEDEVVTVTLVVAALTKMLNDQGTR